MPSKKRDPGLYLVDIFLASYLIDRYAEGFESGDALLHDRLHWDGVIREFEIVGEATQKLLKSGWLEESEGFRQIVDFRNRIVHEYFGIDEEIVYDAIRNALPEFVHALKEISAKRKTDLLPAIEAALVENSRNQEITQFLKQLKREFETF